MKNEKMNTESNNTTHFLTGLFIGGVVAGISALLTAPKSGKATRQAIAESGKSMQQAAVEKVTEVREKAADALEGVEKQMDDLRDNAENVIDQFAEKTNRTIRKGKALVHEGREKISPTPPNLMDEIKTAMSGEGGVKGGLKEKAGDFLEKGRSIFSRNHHKNGSKAGVLPSRFKNEFRSEFS